MTLRRRTVTATSTLTLLALGACTTDRAVAPDRPFASLSADVGVETGTYLVNFRGKIPADFASRVAALGGEVVFAHAGAGVGAVSGLTDAGAATLAASGLQVAADATVDIEAVVGDVESGTSDGTLVGEDGTDSPTNPAAAFFYARQWNMRAIDADDAWAAGKLGSSAIKVGIRDTGIDYLHPDLYGRVDLDNSVSFLSAEENARVQAAFPGAHPVADLNYHGTHVAATVASNGLAAAGVTSRVTLVGIKVCAPGTPANGFRGTCPTSSVFAGVLYAADLGLPVINMSLGGTFNRRDAAFPGDGPAYMATINSVFNYARQQGTLVVVSAGNSAIDMQHDGNGYKTYCDAPHVACVSATGPTSAPDHGGVYANPDALAPYSNYGGKVTVAAPGGAGTNPSVANPIPNRGWIYAACSGFSLAVPGCQSRFYNPTTGAWSASVIGINGTSMASPHAAGVAALVAERVGTNPASVRNGLAATADDLGQPGNDWIYGAGRVNAARAAGL